MPQKPMVLVMESEQREAQSLATMIRDPLWEITAAVDAPAAIKMAREHKPGLLMLSGRVLGGGGLVALKHLRSSVHTAAIPAVAVSGSGMHASFIEAGVQECFPERTSPTDLRAAVAHHLANRPVVREAASASLRDSSRLAALKRTGLLDTPAEEAYDRLTRLASRLMRVPTTLVSLVDHDRQFFKSQFGLGEPWASRRQTPLSHSFCQWVVSSGENLVVSNARSDEVLRENRAVDELGVIAYAGALVATPEGNAIGTLCAIDTARREWNDDEISTLTDLRDIVESYVASRTDASDGSARAAIAAATRVLLRPNPNFSEADRADLVSTIDDLSQRLVR